MYSCLIWYNPRKDIFYHKFIKGFAVNYDLGMSNSYGHLLMYKFKLDNINDVPIKYRFKKKVIKYLIKELENI